MNPIAGFSDTGTKTDEFAAVIGKEISMAGQIGLFEGGGCQGILGVEEAGQLGYQIFSLDSGGLRCQIGDPRGIWVQEHSLPCRGVLVFGILFVLLLERALREDLGWRRIANRYEKAFQSSH